jgi:uncharacterized membrane protein
MARDICRLAGKAAVLVGELNGDRQVRWDDAKIARKYTAEALSVTTNEGGKLAKSVARAPQEKDVADYAAVEAAIALPPPIAGPAIGAAVGRVSACGEHEASRNLNFTAAQEPSPTKRSDC